jgi:arylsulfatase A-like enzyme
MKSLIFLITLSVFVCTGRGITPRGHAHHVVVVVWDGMRPDFVSQKMTPNLWNLAQQGVIFRHHHPVYTSSTEVNGTAMATGAYPEHSGIMANREYRPEVSPLAPVGMESQATISASKSPYMAVPTVVEMLHAAGRQTAIAGTKGVALLQDWAHRQDSAAARASVIFDDGKTEPPAAMVTLTGTLGAWPETIEFPNIPEDQWTAAALTQVMWAKGVPAYSMLWMSDPDYSQHQMAPGSEMALAAIRSVDDRLGTVLAALDAKGVRDDTDVFVISDHGFSTIARPDDPVSALRAGGIEVTGTAFSAPPRPGQVLAVGNGGSYSFYVIGHDETIGRKLTDFLQTTDYTGVLFSRWGLPGTFDLHTGHIATPEAPDVVMALHWTAGPNLYGAPGLLDGDAGRRKGKGSHASLSAYEMHNTLIAAGPDFRKGWEDQTPTGNIDLAPTVLWILGVPHAPMDGRVLLEAMPGHILGRVVSQTVLTATNPANGWSQYLKVSRVGSTEYFDEGNRGTPQPAPSRAF